MKDKKITLKDAQNVLKDKNVDPETANEILEALTAASKNPSPWWVIALKVVAYLIGLVLAGYGTSAAAQTFLPIV